VLKLELIVKLQREMPDYCLSSVDVTCRVIVA